MTGDGTCLRPRCCKLFNKVLDGGWLVGVVRRSRVGPYWPPEKLTVPKTLKNNRDRQSDVCQRTYNSEPFSRLPSFEKGLLGSATLFRNMPTTFLAGLIRSLAFAIKDMASRIVLPKTFGTSLKEGTWVDRAGF